MSKPDLDAQRALCRLASAIPAHIRKTLRHDDITTLARALGFTAADAERLTQTFPRALMPELEAERSAKISAAFARRRELPRYRVTWRAGESEVQCTLPEAAAYVGRPAKALATALRNHKNAISFNVVVDEVSGLEDVVTVTRLQADA